MRIVTNKGLNRVYQLALETPGISPAEAASLNRCCKLLSKDVISYVSRI